MGVRSTCEARVMSWLRAVALRADRVSLEPLAVEHASEMVATLAPQDLYRFTGGEPPTLEELEARYRRQIGGQSDDGRAGWLNWIIRPAGGGPAIGFVQATLAHEGDELVADLAWLITPSKQGRGLAGQAADAVTTWLTSRGVDRLQACIHPDHTASARVAQRLGLTRTSTLIDGEVLWEAVISPLQQCQESAR
jgi:RimJ/RimL family protein N-acetyltransferase